MEMRQYYRAFRLVIKKAHRRKWLLCGCCSIKEAQAEFLQVFQKEVTLIFQINTMYSP